MPRHSLVLWTSVLLLALCSPGFAQSDPEDPSKQLVVASLTSEHDALAPGATTNLVVRLQIKPEWHVYWLNPGDAGVPTQVEVKLPQGLESSSLKSSSLKSSSLKSSSLKSSGPLWPAPSFLAHEDGFVDFSYEGELVVLLPLTLDAKAAGLVGKDLSLEVNVTWLVCKEACIPGRASLKIALPVRAKASDRKLQAAGAALAKAVRPSLPSPLPEAVKVRFKGLELQFTAPGAKSLIWFPLAPEAAGPADLTLLRVEGESLGAAYPSEVRAAKAVRGLLAIQTKTSTTYHWVEVPSPKP